MADDVVNTVEEQAASAVAPESVSESNPLGTVVERLEHVADKLTGVASELPAHTEPETVAETAETAVPEQVKDNIPIRRPWTHRHPLRWSE